MQLSLQQAADALGKSVRQVRYQVKNGSIPATKLGNQWYINSDDLPLTAGQRTARERKQAQLQNAVEDVLALPTERRRRYSVKDLRAFRIGAPLYRRISAHLGPEHAACSALRESLEQLARGCHRYRNEDKASAYRLARDAASRAACELALLPGDDSDDATAAALLDEIEQELMAALAGLLRRLDRRARRTVALA